ncbi:hemolysin family protein [Tepidibacillus infernus]|uniref:Hemolysin n=1 Tax=Tepidibacillus decaturensis TaxID=1413211 RepID=A0A135L0L4_9BACI|nr:hemolysin family protein [Tepidibacillus decaturensis]KXG42515.1 hypothetical protein U473_13615 [Tepidibacillus decaturensis]
METIPLGSIALLTLLLLLSAFFSGSETAYSSLNKIRVKNYAEENRKGAKNALYISVHFDKTLSTILVGNNIVNIAAATITTKITTDLFNGNTALVISTIVITVLILIFGEILPKSFAKEYAESFALAVSGVLKFLILLFTPVTWLFLQLKKAISRMMGEKETIPSVTEDEIKTMIDIGEEEGTIDKSEKELVHSALDFNDILVREILKPRIDIVAVEVNNPIEVIKQTFMTERYSRIPVYDGNIDHVIGILSERDFYSALLQEKKVNIRSLLRKPTFVVGTMKISSLLSELQRSKTHMAIVVDEYGGTDGLITMEDILEEIVGEIWDEHDEKESFMDKLDNHTYIFSADFPIDDFSQIVNIRKPDTIAHSIGGWMVEQLQHMPKVGEKIVYEHVEIVIEEMERLRIKKVKVDVKEHVKNH